MPHSPCATVHGLCLFAIGALLIASPSKAATLFIAAASQLGAKIAASQLLFTSPLLGSLLCAYGISHLHISAVSPKASAVMLCTEGVLLSALCISCLLNTAIIADPLFVTFLTFSGFFTLWATFEYSTTTAASSGGVKNKTVKKAA